jgi:hypothetical protein
LAAAVAAAAAPATGEYPLRCGSISDVMRRSSWNFGYSFGVRGSGSMIGGRGYSHEEVIVRFDCPGSVCFS